MPLTRVRFFLGPAGSGKTRHCIRSIQEELASDPDGPPLLCLAPQQSVFQIKERILKEPGERRVRGFTRLQVLSFDQLAREIHRASDDCGAEVLKAEGRSLVLYSLLLKHGSRFGSPAGREHLFALSARMDRLLRELDPYRRELQELSRSAAGSLALKIGDLERLSGLYRQWLADHRCRDPELFLPETLRQLESLSPQEGIWAPSRIWMDGFQRLDPRELALLIGVMRRCRSAWLYFCLDRDRPGSESGDLLDFWSCLDQEADGCRQAMELHPSFLVETSCLPRCPEASRWRESPQLRHLERRWTSPEPFQGAPAGPQIRISACPDRHAEAEHVARSILREVRQEGIRFRDMAVIVRRLSDYSSEIRSVFTRRGIPFFLDHRIRGRHHPAVLLTLGALRMAVHGWRNRDWFSVLKTGLAGSDAGEACRLELQAGRKGIEGRLWTRSGIHREAGLSRERLARLAAPFVQLARSLGCGGDAPLPVDGAAIRKGVRELWSALRIEEVLEGWSRSSSQAAHRTLWGELDQWLAGVEQALPGRDHTLGDLLAPLEAGLDSLTVGTIPQGADEVLVSQVDRTRTPEIRQAFLMGANSSVFPAQPEGGSLLEESEREALEEAGIPVCPSTRRGLAQEQYLAYIACTRPSRRLHVSYAQLGGDGQPLTPSPLVDHLQHLFPGIEIERIPPLPAPPPPPDPGPAVLSPALARRLFLDRQRRLPTSVSRLEEYAQCPFRFFVRSGLGIEEERPHDLGPIEAGTFHHLVLQRFHQKVREEGREWRDLTPGEARDLIGSLADREAREYHGRIFRKDPRQAFNLEGLKAQLQDFVQAQVEWMREGGYGFDPAEAELSFGGRRDALEARLLELEEGAVLALSGKLDRVDLGSGGAAVVIDYKSSSRQPSRSRIEKGLDLQLFAYLDVLESHPGIPDRLGLDGSPRPDAVFLAPLQGRPARTPEDRDALREEGRPQRVLALQGFFQREALSRLAGRQPDPGPPCLIPFRLNRDGSLNRQRSNHLSREEFEDLAGRTRSHLRTMGLRILGGGVGVDPYEPGSCQSCGYASVCRIDPHSHQFRRDREEP